MITVPLNAKHAEQWDIRGIVNVQQSNTIDGGKSPCGLFFVQRFSTACINKINE